MIDHRSETIRKVVLERYRFWANELSLTSIAPMMTSEVEVMRELDHMAQGIVWRWYTSVAKGEITKETKEVSHEYEFEVFASWIDHLKYQIRERRVLPWLPEWARKKLRVKYQTIVKKRAESVPVSIIRVCPHATFSWERESNIHIAYLFPSMGPITPPHPHR